MGLQGRGDRQVLERLTTPQTEGVLHDPDDRPGFLVGQLCLGHQDLEPRGVDGDIVRVEPIAAGSEHDRQ